MNFQPFVRRFVAGCLLFASVFAMGLAWAVDPFTIRDIRVEGLQRVEPGTVFASLPVRNGDTYTDEKGAAAIRSLFALGLFADVRLEASGGVLVVIVEERPTIADVDFSGTKEFDKDNLKRALRDVGLAEGRPYDKGLVDRAEQELKRQYLNRSLYGSEVVTTVTPIERNRVNLSFAVTEGEPARITEIRIVGNRAFSESTLRNLFDLDTGGWMSWYTKSDRYSRSKLNGDLETLRSYYLARGYLEFNIDSTQVAISPDKKGIGITINITEGQKFNVSGVRLEGNYLGKDEEFKSFVTIRTGEAYNADHVAATVKAFTDYFGNFGYAFARVEARPEVDRNNGLVSISLRAEPQRRVYVRQIQIAGNLKTRDEVIRRELRQLEASWYDANKIKLSRDRVDRLSYFKEVSVDTREIPDVPDQVDLVFTVSERNTGSISLGGSVSSSEGLGLSFQFQQDNAFGSGSSLGLNVNTSRVNRTFVISSTDPYFTQDGVSRTLDIYNRTSSPYQDSNLYQLVTSGASIRFGVPFTEFDTVYFGIGLENIEIVPGTNLPNQYLTYANQFGYSSRALPLTVGWARDRRDSALVPSKGTVHRVFGEWGLPSGDAQYVKATYQFQYFYPFTRAITGAFNLDAGYGATIGNRPYPLFKNVYGGGLGSVRGFDQGSLGPRDAVTDIPLGGQRKINMNLELLVPFPGTGNDRTLRLFGFLDMGNVWADSETISWDSLRGSTGIGVTWVSPVGPMRLAFSNPFRSFAGDRIQQFQFQIGSTF
jgi:outer membrane protein insertion porin family